SYFPLPDEYKRLIGPTEPHDWTAPEYPDRQHVHALRAEAGQVDGARRKLRQAQDEAKKVGELRAKLESARDRHAKAQTHLRAGEPATLREEFNSKQADEKAVVASLAGTKKAIAAAETEVDRRQRDLSNIDIELTEITGKLNEEESSRKQSTEAIERAKKSLPAVWQKPVETAGLTERAKWQDEFDALAAKGAEK